MGNSNCGQGGFAEAQEPSAGAVIGAELEDIRKQLFACSEDLKTVLGAQGAEFVDDTREYLHGMSCKIAVIGQVKAGKSTFINAVIGRPGLLPTHVNPWTSAVTRLHFGTHEAGGDVAARFAFFGQDEWHNLINGGGHIRELTKRLVPGFEVELLQHHVNAMRERSELRLGARLPLLLGSQHEYVDVTTDILERYVCSGIDRLGSSDPEQNIIYSDVVKQADLFFPSATFGFPTILIDTPGTNDPFLVRDEITRRTLEMADVYIVILSARQALGLSDLALLRMLRSLNKNRVVIFINRIDELANPARDLPDILDYARMRLSLDLPGVDFPIVAGSAIWAQRALQCDGEDAVAQSAAVKAYAAYLGNADGSHGAATDDQHHVHDGLPRDADILMQCSGLPRLCDVLAELVSRSHAGLAMRQVAGSFWEMAQLSLVATEQEIERLQKEQVTKEGDAAHIGDKPDADQAEMDKTKTIVGKLHKLLSDIQARTDQIIDTSTERLVTALGNTLDDFATIECFNLRKAISQSRRLDTWQCATAPLRNRFEVVSTDGYTEAEDCLREIETLMLPRLRQLLYSWLPDVQLPPMLKIKTEHVNLPTLAALGEPVALDLGEPWWKRWWGRQRMAANRSNELEQIIRSEFSPIIDALVEAVRSQLRDRQSVMLHNATMIVVSMVELLEQKQHDRMERRSAPAVNGHATFGRKLERRRDERVTELRHHAALASQTIQRLQRVSQPQ